MAKEKLGLFGMLTGTIIIVILQLTSVGVSLYLLYLLIMALRKYIGT